MLPPHSPHRADFERMLSALDRYERTGVPAERVAATIAAATEAPGPRRTTRSAATRRSSSRCAGCCRRLLRVTRHGGPLTISYVARGGEPLRLPQMGPELGKRGSYSATFGPPAIHAAQMPFAKTLGKGCFALRSVHWEQFESATWPGVAWGRSLWCRPGMRMPRAGLNGMRRSSTASLSTRDSTVRTSRVERGASRWLRWVTRLLTCWRRMRDSQSWPSAGRCVAGGGCGRPTRWPGRRGGWPASDYMVLSPTAADDIVISSRRGRGLRICSGAEELEQVGVDDVVLRGGHAVREAGVRLEGSVPDEPGRQGA